jgi:hypothetical protein
LKIIRKWNLSSDKMDSILRSTIRVTKCLLSYGLVQENIEKILLEAFKNEIERYPVLCEKNMYVENGWRKSKNCTFCEIVITELASQCSACYKTVCRFCLKNKCCSVCNELFDKKCGICKDIPSIPVICYLEQCECKNLYCLTCLRDAMGLNGESCTLKACPKCENPFKIPNEALATRRMQGKDIYGVPRYSTHFLDVKHGEIFCPRKCGQKMLRVDAQVHLQLCPNIKKKF